MRSAKTPQVDKVDVNEKFLERHAIDEGYFDYADKGVTLKGPGLEWFKQNNKVVF